jgi:RHS repeat-associated protein
VAPAPDAQAGTFQRTIRYAYDDLNRVTGAQESGSTTNTLTYADDRAGNRTDGGKTYDAANQVNGWTYDAAGNLTNDGTTSYAYDALSRLTTRGSVGQTYNGDDVLVAQTSGSTTTRYAQDLASPLSQVLQIGTTNYLYGMERLAAQTGSTRTWYGADALGSVRQTLDAAGVPQATTSDDPWGQLQSGSVPTFGVTGDLHDGAAGLVHLRARWYNTRHGRLLSQDIWVGNSFRPGSLHKYAYAENDPVNAYDPTGLATFRVWTAAFIRPASLEFIYPKGQWFAGVWEGDNRDAYNMRGMRPSSRIFAEVTVDTESPSGEIAGSAITGVGETVIHYLDSEGRVQADRRTAPDEARVRVARDGNYILVRLTNRGSNPLTPSGATPPIMYDYNVVFDLDKKRVLVGGETSAFPSHEIHIENLGRRVVHPNYAGGTNPLALFIPPIAFEPIEASVSAPTLTCPSRNRFAWSVLDLRYRLSYLARFFPTGLPWETF